MAKTSEIVQDGYSHVDVGELKERLSALSNWAKHQIGKPLEQFRVQDEQILIPFLKSVKTGLALGY